MFVCILTFFLATALRTQDTTGPKIDSLTSALESTTDPDQEAELLLKLGHLMLRREPNTAKAYARRLINLKKESAPSYQLASAYRIMEDFFTLRGIADSAEFYLKNIIALAPDLPADPRKSELLHGGFRDLGSTYNRIGRDNEAIELFYQALAVPEISGFDSILTYNGIGNSLFELSRYDEAIGMFQNVLDFARRTENKRLEAMALVNSTMPLDALSRYDLSEEYLLKAISLIREIKDPEGLAYALRNLAFLYSVTDRKQASRDTMWAAIQQSIKIGNIDMQVGNIGSSLSLQDTSMAKAPRLVAMAEELLRPGQQNLQNNKMGLHPPLAKYFIQTREYDQAIYQAKEGLMVMRELGVDSTMDYLSLIENLAIAQQETGQYREAAANFRKTKNLFKAIKAKNDETAFAETAVKMKMTENELARQQAETATELEKQASAAKTRLFGIAALAAALIFAVLLWAYRRISAQKALVDQSLSEKEVLLREIHHRVKNNLQIISSLLQKQARQSESKELKDMIRDGQERIQSMALIHENLYRSEKLSGVSIKEYLQDLTDNVSKSQGTDKVAVHLKVEDEHLDLDTAIPLGLILNELITNAYKYAFPDNRKGAIMVAFKKQSNGQRLLTISDDGVGLPTDQEVRQRNSLGLNLVKGLVRQLRGSIDWVKRESGTSVAIQF